MTKRSVIEQLMQPANEPRKKKVVFCCSKINAAKAAVSSKRQKISFPEQNTSCRNDFLIKLGRKSIYVTSIARVFMIVTRLVLVKIFVTAGNRTLVLQVEKKGVAHQAWPLNCEGGGSPWRFRGRAVDLAGPLIHRMFYLGVGVDFN